MERVTLMLAEEHPLIRSGFRGKFRIGGDAVVEIVGTSDRSTPRRRLPTRKARALSLMALGCGPAGLAKRLGLCLERAEALHEELSRTMGLDQITRLVRSALPPGRPGAGGDPAGRAVSERGDVGEIPTGVRTMGTVDLVRLLFPEAEARSLAGGSWAIVIALSCGDYRLAEGRTEEEAWESAGSHLSRDEWFRPIIELLQVTRATRRAGA